MKKILLADDHPVFRRGLKNIIEDETPYTVVADSSTGEESVALARKHQPDIVLMDIGMPGVNGLVASRQILKSVPGAKIIILSIHRDRNILSEAIRLGVSGYLLKDSAPRELLDALEVVSKGQRYFSPALSDTVAEIVLSVGPPAIEGERLGKLTLREMQILSLTASGTAKTEIARKLNISPETVKSHRRKIKEKLHLKKLSDVEDLALDQYLKPLP